MGLFKSYQRSDSTAADKRKAEGKNTDKKAIDTKAKKSTANKGSAKPAASEAPAATPAKAPHEKKGVPTPSRKQVEREYMERLHRKPTRKEQRRMERIKGAQLRAKEYAKEDARPEKVLLRNFVDARLHISEFLLPLLLLLLVPAFAFDKYPMIANWIMLASYILLLICFIEIIWEWLRFKKLLYKRIVHVNKRGLFSYFCSRIIQIRRFRMPAPEIKRGEDF